MSKENEEKKIALSHISHILSQAKIPHLYNVREETITLRNVDMTDVLLELHFYQDEYITDLKKRNFELEKDLSELTIENEYQRVISDKNEQISTLEMKIKSLESLVNILKHCNNCKHHHITGCVYEDKKECNWQTKSKWELCK